MSNYDYSLSVLKRSASGLAASFAILFCLWLFNPNIYIVFAGVLSLTLSVNLYNAFKSGWVVESFSSKLFTGLGTSIILISLLYAANYYLAGWGVLGVAIIIILLSGYRLWKSRLLYMEAVDEGVRILRGLKR